MLDNGFVRWQMRLSGKLPFAAMVVGSLTTITTNRQALILVCVLPHNRVFAHSPSTAVNMPRNGPPFSSAKTYFSWNAKAWITANRQGWSTGNVMFFLPLPCQYSRDTAQANNTIKTIWAGSAALRTHYSNHRTATPGVQAALPVPHYIPDAPYTQADVALAKTNRTLPPAPVQPNAQVCGNGEEEREGCSIERAPTSDYIQ
jgi:hypothetical protein